MNANQRIYRLTAISRFPHPEGGQRVVVRVYSHPDTLMLEWWSQKTDATLKVGCLVAVDGSIVATGTDRKIIFGQLVLAEQPSPDLNLFDTVPGDWKVCPTALRKAAQYWSSMPQGHRKLFNQLYWDACRFKRYMTANRAVPTRFPVSHFAWMIEMAERVLPEDQEGIAPDTADLTLSALLLDAGSVDAPRPNSYVRLLEWLLVISRQPQLPDDNILERMAWKIIQIHGMSAIESGAAQVDAEASDAEVEVDPELLN